MNESLNRIDPALARALDSFGVPPPSSDFAARIVAAASATPREARSAAIDNTRSWVRRGRARRWQGRALVGVLAVSLTGATAIAASMLDRIKAELPRIAQLFTPSPAKQTVVVARQPAAVRVATAALAAGDRDRPPVVAAATIAPKAVPVYPVDPVAMLPAPRSVVIGDGEQRTPVRATTALARELRPHVSPGRLTVLPAIPVRPIVERIATSRRAIVTAADKPLTPRLAEAVKRLEPGLGRPLAVTAPPALDTPKPRPEVAVNGLDKPGATDRDQLRRLRELRSLRGLRSLRQTIRRARNH